MVTLPISTFSLFGSHTCHAVQCTPQHQSIASGSVVRVHASQPLKHLSGNEHMRDSQGTTFASCWGLVRADHRRHTRREIHLRETILVMSTFALTGNYICEPFCFHLSLATILYIRRELHLRPYTQGTTFAKEKPLVVNTSLNRYIQPAGNYICGELLHSLPLATSFLSTTKKLTLFMNSESFTY